MESGTVRVQASSRLHFGFLNFGAAGQEAENAGSILPGRFFGGVGLMIRAPGVRLNVRPAREWSAAGPLAERALAFARLFAQTIPSDTSPQHLVVEQAAPEHVGLGTGTQLGLAVAQVLTAAWGLTPLPAPELARRVGRGRRSALGVHGFAQGGFLVEAGKRTPDTLAPLVARALFPEDWRIVLIISRSEQGLHGAAEKRALELLHERKTSPARTDVLCRLVLLGMLPALAERDLAIFGSALCDFNRLVGDAFAGVQGGIYASPRLEEIIHYLRQEGVRGVAQSSWGPTLCALAEDEPRADDLVRRLRQRFALDAMEVFATVACNHGAEW